jgi:hypothetical protein
MAALAIELEEQQLISRICWVFELRKTRLISYAILRLFKDKK